MKFIELTDHESKRTYLVHVDHIRCFSEGIDDFVTAVLSDGTHISIRKGDFYGTLKLDLLELT